MSYLDISGIEKNYDDFSVKVDLHINKGEFFTLLGPSGCGKTTLLRIIAGFITPDAGRIIVNGRDITKIHPRDRNISIVFQNYALFPDRTVYRNISYGPESKKWGKTRITEKVENLLQIINMHKHASRKPETLSGGEKQRTALARAIAVEPDILLLDEPLSALDVSLRNTLRNEIRDIHDKTGLTTIYVTHDQEEALYLSDRVCVMNNGAVEQTDVPEKVYGIPETVFTASFMGESSLIPCIRGKTSLKAADRLWEGIFRIPPHEFISGTDKSYIFFRPECCEIQDADKAGESPDNNYSGYFSASVIKKSFMGSYYRIEALCGNSRVILYDYFPYKTRGEKTVSFRIKEENTILFSGTADQF